MTEIACQSLRGLLQQITRFLHKAAIVENAPRSLNVAVRNDEGHGERDGVLVEISADVSGQD